MITFHRKPRRHANSSRDYGTLSGVLALAIGATSFYPALYYFGFTGATAAMASEDITDRIPKATRPFQPERDKAEGQPLNILLMGSDTRAGGNAAIGGAVDTLNNDTTILVHISADRTRIELLSIPRDSRVRLPGCFRSDGSRTYPETTKFNKAFYIGGMRGNIGDAVACTIATVESATGIYIHEYVVIDFVGVVNVINTLTPEGLPMCIPFDVKAPEAQLDLKAGPQNLSGHQAIAWARARKFTFASTSDRRAFEAYYNDFYDDHMAFNGGDIGRIRRQQELISKVFEVFIEDRVFFHPKELIFFMESVAESLTVSPNIKNSRFLFGLAFSLRKVDRANIVFREVPGKMHEDGSDLVWLPEAYDLFEQIINDEPISGNSVADLSHVKTDPATPSPTPTEGGQEPIDLADKLLGACQVG